MTTSHAIDPYLAVLAGKRKSVKTQGKYRWLLNKLADAHPHTDVNELTFEQLLLFLKEWGGRADSTLAQRISIVKMFFRWLYVEGHVEADAAAKLERPKLGDPAENDQVAYITGDDVRHMFEAADGWIEILLLHLLAYTGARKHAIAQVRRKDWNRQRNEIRFLEKGRKHIAKWVAPDLQAVLEAADNAGLYESPDDYLIPSRAAIRRSDGVRHDAFVWEIVKEIGERVDVPDVHVHAFRAAFACEFLRREKEQGRDGLLALKEILGHSRIETTMVYLRRMERGESMGRMADFSWGAAPEAPRVPLIQPPEPSTPAAPNHSLFLAQHLAMPEPTERVLPPQAASQAVPGKQSVGTEQSFDLFDLLAGRHVDVPPSMPAGERLPAAAPTLDPDWTPEAGYSHADRIRRILEAKERDRLEASGTPALRRRDLGVE